MPLAYQTPAWYIPPRAKNSTQNIPARFIFTKTLCLKIGAMDTLLYPGGIYLMSQERLRVFFETLTVLIKFFETVGKCHKIIHQ